MKIKQFYEMQAWIKKNNLEFPPDETDLLEKFESEGRTVHIYKIEA